MKKRNKRTILTLEELEARLNPTAIQPAAVIQSVVQAPTPSPVTLVSNWALSLQYQNQSLSSFGAVRVAQAPGRYDNGVAAYQVNPYFANVGLSSLLQSRVAGSVTTTALYINWYLRHLNADGTISNYWYTGSGANPASTLTTASDSDDAYAATFLSMTWQYVQAGGNLSVLQAAGVRAQFERVAQVILNLQDPSDGLTWAKATYPIKYLADNSEVYAGLLAMANLETTVFHGNASLYTNAAARVATGLQGFWNPSTNTYAYAKDGSGNYTPVSLSNWDLAVYQLWPTLQGVPNPHTAQVMQSLNTHFNWTNSVVDSTGYVWPEVGEAALMNGNTAQATAFSDWLMSYEFPAGATLPQHPFTIADAGLLALLLVQTKVG